MAAVDLVSTNGIAGILRSDSISPNLATSKRTSLYPVRTCRGRRRTASIQSIEGNRGHFDPPAQVLERLASFRHPPVVKTKRWLHPRSSASVSISSTSISSEADPLCSQIMSKLTPGRAHPVRSQICMQKHLVTPRPPRSTGIVEERQGPEGPDQSDTVVSKLVELRWQREVVERWVNCSEVTAESKVRLHEVLSEMSRELRALEAARPLKVR